MLTNFEPGEILYLFYRTSCVYLFLFVIVVQYRRADADVPFELQYKISHASCLIGIHNFWKRHVIAKLEMTYWALSINL